MTHGIIHLASDLQVVLYLDNKNRLIKEGKW